MMPQYTIKERFRKGLHLFPPFSTWLSEVFYRNYQKASGCVFMLHRVDVKDEKRLSPNENMKVSPRYLENLIIKYRSRGVSFLSMDELCDYLKGKNTHDRPFVCFTLDDGYKDNFTNAYPIFKRYNVPFTIYVATDFPDYKVRLWWYELEDLILSNSDYKLGNGEIIPCFTYRQKCDAFMYIRRLVLDLNREGFDENYLRLLNIRESHAADYAKTMNMSWDDITIMAKDSLCTIGGHSVSHPPFNKLSEQEVEKEVMNGCRRLEYVIGRKVEHFAYPFGTSLEIGDREHRLIKRYQFKTVSTTAHGYINSDSNIFKLPRVLLSESF